MAVSTTAASMTTVSIMHDDSSSPLSSVDCSSILQTIGWELTIFLTTLLTAFILTRVPNPMRKPAATRKGSKEQTRFEAVRAATPSGANSCGPAAQVKNHQDSGRSGNDMVSDSGEAARRLRPYLLEVCSAPIRQPGLKARGRMVSLYFDIYRDQITGDMLTESLASKQHTPLDFYSSLFQSSIRTGQYQYVQDLLNDMEMHSVPRTLHLYEDTMKCLAGQKQHLTALGLYEHLIADGLKPSAVTYSCLASFALEVGQVSRCIFFFKQLSQLSTPSIRAYMTALRAYARQQDFSGSVEVLRDMQNRRVKVDSLVLNVILATGVSTGQLEAVEALLKEAEEEMHDVQDTVSYNTLLKGYAQRSMYPKAEQLLCRMLANGITANAITYNTIMDAAVRSNRSAEAWRTLARMREAGLRPDKYTCSILVKSLQPAERCRLEDIYKCLAVVREVGPGCDQALQRTLIQSMVDAASHLDKGQEAVMDIMSKAGSKDSMLVAECKRTLAKVMAQTSPKATNNADQLNQMLDKKRVSAARQAPSSPSTTCSSNASSGSSTCSSRDGSPRRSSSLDAASEVKESSKALGALLSCCQDSPWRAAP